MKTTLLILIAFAIAGNLPANTQQNENGKAYAKAYYQDTVKKEKAVHFTELPELVILVYTYDERRDYRMEYIFSHPLPVCPENIKAIAINLACPAGDPARTITRPPQKTGRDLSRPSAKFYELPGP
jgi:hypothetical protein